MYLTITNQGLAPVESFTILGLSTARGDKNKIGQFGSGAKHGILTCLRNRIVPQVWIGTEPLEFATERGEINGKGYERVMYSWRGNVERSSMVLDFGALDWTKLEMGLREFVSNALDSVDGDATKVGILITNKVVPSSGTTTIAIPLTPTVEQFTQNLPKWFLHWTTDYAPDKQILKKDVIGKCQFYRKGVFVRESCTQSLYDYNLGEESTIDESRNMSDYAITDNVGRTWSKAETNDLVELFRRFTEITPNILEGMIYNYSLLSKQNKHNWHEAWEKVNGNNCAIATKNDANLINAAIKKKIPFAIVPDNWVIALESSGISTLKTVMQNYGHDSNGRMIQPPSGSLLTSVAKIWSKLEAKGLTANKSMPKVMQYNEPMNGGSEIIGYYCPKTQTVHFNIAGGNIKKCIIEELGHYITGALDETRDFQDWAFRCAAEFIK